MGWKYGDDDDDDDEDKGCEKDKKKDEKGFGEELLKSRNVVISEPVSQELAKKVYAQLLILDARSQEEPITVYVNSPGGDADSGFGIYDMMRFVAAPIRTVVTGLCASAGVIIFLGADEGQNFATPNSRFLLHQPSTGVHGDASDLEITANEITKTRERYNQIVANVTGKSVEEVTQDADRDFWMSPEESVEYGLVKRIVTSVKDLELLDT